MPATQATILERLLDPQPEELTPEAARYFLKLDLRPADRSRLKYLAEKARTGALTPDDSAELEQFERVNQLLFRVKTKASQVLAQSSTSRSGTASPQAAGEALSPLADIPPGILRSQQAFWRDLPELLRDKRNHGKWVCYHGDERIGIAKNDEPLIRECIRRGIPDDEYDLATIRPHELPPWVPEEVEPLALHHLDDYPLNCEDS